MRVVRTVRPLLAALLVPALPAVAEAQPERDPPAALRAAGPSDPDVWPEDAASERDVARRARTAMPFTRAQLDMLARLVDQTRRATARGAGGLPAGRTRRIRAAEGGSSDIPAIFVRRGYTTAISFTDITGAPWPIEEILVDRRFLPADDAVDAVRGSHLLYVSPRQPWLHGNAVVKLARLADPLVMTLGDDGENADFRVDIRLARAGPNADPAALTRPETFRAGDPHLAGLLSGVVPPGAERLEVAGGGEGDRAWRFGDDLLLVTPLVVLSPGPWAAERSGRRWAYRLPDTPFALATMDGRETRLAFRRADEAGGDDGAGDAR